jgi:RHS repeat-associated protein
MVEKITSYSDAAGTTPANEVQNVCNSFAQVVTQYQEHGGAVNTGTSPKVEYAYADGSNNTIRPTSMTYPNGRVLQYLYDDTAADKLSRIRTLKWDGTDVCQYSYLGLGTFVITDYLEPEVKLDYALGSGANPYTGFDQFGRIIDLLWEKYGASSSSSSSSSGGPGNELVHLLYGYDQASNRTYREDLVAQAYGKDFDELYEYDGMQRLKKFHRGRLTADKPTIIDPTLQQGWHLDATGNWQNFTQNDQADGSQTLDQQRITNRVNEITAIARTVGADWATPAYDRNGNMTVIPQPKEMTLTYQGTWDAWNRLVKLEEPDGIGGWQNLAEYQYDGQTWRIVTKTYDEGVLDETRHFYFTSRWQDIEERLGTTPGSADAQQQHVCGLRYLDEIITTSVGDSSKVYCCQSAEWSTVANIASDSAIVSRLVYCAYGSAHCLAESFESQSSVAHARFQGRPLDSLVRLYDFRYRQLHSDMGIYLCVDKPRYVDTTNSYEFDASNPINKLDALGRKSWEGNLPSITKQPGSNKARYVIHVTIDNIQCCGNKCVRTVLSAIQQACDLIESTYVAIRIFRKEIAAAYGNPTLGMGALGSLNDDDYAKVLKNFANTVDMCRNGHIKLECDDGVSPTRCQTSPNTPEFYTMSNRFTYESSSPMYICKAACAAGNLATDMAHELGRYAGKQFEDATNDPIWDVRRWDYYISMLTNPDILTNLQKFSK